MSFQAYLDNIEDKTGKTPEEFITMARERGFDDPSTKAGVIVDWLKEDFGLGRGHAMALVHVIKNGAEIGEKHVGTSGVHRDQPTRWSSAGRVGARDRRPSIGTDGKRAVSRGGHCWSGSPGIGDPRGGDEHRAIGIPHQ